MFFDELSNDEWALLAALVSDEPAVRLNRRGRPRAEPRIVANAVLWILTTGEPWSKLPGRYPSGPTCRRRFEEWQLNGTLLEMVRLLSQTGRTFAYVPQPAPPAATKPAAPVVVAPSVRDESLRGVSWKSPESWQAPGVSSSLSNWRSADPIADITRQLSGLANAQAPQTLQQPHQPVARAPMAPGRSFAAAGVSNGVSASVSTGASAFAPAMRPPMRAVLPRLDEAAAVGQAMDLLDAAISSARHTSPPDDDLRSPLSMSLAPRGTQIDDPRGFTIFVAAEQVPNVMYRAWAEIMKDGRRVERSGLVGPRFADADEAQQYALDWALQWIDRECLTLAAAEVAPPVEEVVVLEERAAAQVHSPTPSHVAPARPLPVRRHVPEPVTINHGAPLHGPLHAFRGPLRRYPSEPVVTTVVSATTESTSAERYPSYPEFISHAG